MQNLIFGSKTLLPRFESMTFVLASQHAIRLFCGCHKNVARFLHFFCLKPAAKQNLVLLIPALTMKANLM